MGVVMTSTQAAGAASTIYMIVMLVIMFALMYFLMIRPQKKEQKRVTAMLNDMEVGDAVVTTGGFYGVIIDITDEDVIVEFGNNKNCRIPMKKAAIAEVEKASDATGHKQDKQNDQSGFQQRTWLVVFSFYTTKEAKSIFL